MYDTLVLDKLNEQIKKQKCSVLLMPETSKIITDYLGLLEKLAIEKDREKHTIIKDEILKLFSLEGDGWGNYKYNAESVNPVITFILSKVELKNILSYYHAQPRCGQLLNFSSAWAKLVENTQKYLRDEKFTTIKPIIELNLRDATSYWYDEIFSVIVVIINSHSFIRLTVSPDKVEERIQRAIRKDIIDIKLRDKQLEFMFHSIRDTIRLDLASYKEARELQEAIHNIRNTPFVTRPSR